MEKRKLGITELMDRLNPMINIGAKDVILLPDRYIEKKDMPCILVMLGEDVVTKPSSAGTLGYPCERTCQVIVECWGLDYNDTIVLWENMRKAALINGGGLVERSVIIKEEKSDGPYQVDGLQGAFGMRLYLSMLYVDHGPDFT